MKTGDIYIVGGSFIGIIVLIFLQYKIFKKENNSKNQTFGTSKSLIEIIKELLVVMLGATLAIVLTNMVETDHTKEVAYRLLEIYDYRISYPRNSVGAYITWIEDDIMSEEEAYKKVENMSYVFEQLLEHEEIIKTMHPHIYGLIESAIFEMDECYDFLKGESNISSNNLIHDLSGMVYIYDNVLWLMEMEKEHLAGTYTEDEVEDIVIDYITNRQENRAEYIQNGQ